MAEIVVQKLANKHAFSAKVTELKKNIIYDNYVI